MKYIGKASSLATAVPDQEVARVQDEDETEAVTEEDDESLQIVHERMMRLVFDSLGLSTQWRIS